VVLTTPQPEQNLNKTNVLPAQVLLDAVSEIFKRELIEAKTEKEISEMLDVSKAQTKAWLIKLVEAGQLEKTAKPVRYRTKGAAERLL
jgi:transposase